MVEFVRLVLDVVWSVLSIEIPVSSDLVITPWQVIIFALVVGMLLKFTFKGEE